MDKLEEVTWPGTGSRSRLSHGDSVAETRKLLDQLERNSKLRLTVQWTLEEEETE